MGQQRAFVKKGDLIFILAFLVFVAGVLWYRASRPPVEGNWAVVTVDGVEVARYELSTHVESQFVDLSPYGVEIELELKDHQIRFVQSDCPDHICVNTGFVSQEFQSAVCLPNKTAVAIYTPEELPPHPERPLPPPR